MNDLHLLSIVCVYYRTYSSTRKYKIIKFLPRLVPRYHSWSCIKPRGERLRIKPRCACFDSEYRRFENRNGGRIRTWSFPCIYMLYIAVMQQISNCIERCTCTIENNVNINNLKRELNWFDSFICVPSSLFDTCVHLYETIQTISNINKYVSQ